MGKKFKLNIKEFKVKNFITSLENDQKDALKGGGDTRYCPSGQYGGSLFAQQTFAVIGLLTVIATFL